MRSLKNSKGFTLIEMIGVLAVISVLVALVAPRVMETIRDVRPAKMAGDVFNFASGVVNWYKDIETLAPLGTDGLPIKKVTTAVTNWQNQLIHNNIGGIKGAGLWARWRGPYINAIANPPIGDDSRIVNVYSVVSQQQVGPSDAAFDLDAQGDNSAENNYLVYLVIDNVINEDWQRLDEIIDHEINSRLVGPGNPAVATNTFGRVKYQVSCGAGTDNAGGPACDTAHGNVRIYLWSAEDRLDPRQPNTP